MIGIMNNQMGEDPPDFYSANVGVLNEEGLTTTKILFEHHKKYKSTGYLLDDQQVIDGKIQVRIVSFLIKSILIAQGGPKNDNFSHL